MNDEHIEIEDCVIEENNTHSVDSLCQKAVLKRQTTLDAFFSNEPNRKVFISDKLIRRKVKNNRKSITITHSGRWVISLVLQLIETIDSATYRDISQKSLKSRICIYLYHDHGIYCTELNELYYTERVRMLCGNG